MKTTTTLSLLLALLLPSIAHAAEDCGDGVDNDTDGEADEGCYPDVYLGVCESPLSCATAGAPEPNGGVRLVRPPDFDIAVPYGPSLVFQRFYTSHHDPSFQSGIRVNPMGLGFQHNYMSWIVGDDVEDPDTVVLHTRDGAEVVFTYEPRESEPNRLFVPQAGYHFKGLYQELADPFGWTLENLDGTGITYDWDETTGLGLMQTIQDSGISPNEVAVGYNTYGQVLSVTDASGTRNLLFSYDVGNRLESISAGVVGSETLAREFEYSGSRLTSVEQDSTPLETYTWDSTLGRLLTVESAGSTVVEYVWHQAGGDEGKLSEIHTPNGGMGIESGLVPRHYFYEMASSCDEDEDCFGEDWDTYCHLTQIPDVENEPAFAGSCFKSYRDVETISEHADVVPGEVVDSCGECADVSQYSWFSGADFGLKGVMDPQGNWTSYLRDVNGLVTRMVEGDDDDDAETIPLYVGRATYYIYGDPDFPGVVTEVRVQSELSGDECDEDTNNGCKITTTTLTADGKPYSVKENGNTLDASGDPTPYEFTTLYEYDDYYGRLTAIRGPRDGVDDDVEYVYDGAGYLEEVSRRTGYASYLTTTLSEYDQWGKATLVVDPNGKATCRTFDPRFGVLTTSRRVMNGSHSDCGSDGNLDETMTYVYDEQRRLHKTIKPRGNCIEREYDAAGRLELVRNSDLCDDTNGDTMEHTYDEDGHLLKKEWKQNGSTLMREQEYTYSDARRVSSKINPMNTDTAQLFFYDADGLLREQQFEDYGESDAAITWHFDETNRPSFIEGAGNEIEWYTQGIQDARPHRIEDGEGHQINMVWDDMGRKVKQETAETGTTLYMRDEAGNVVDQYEALGDSDETHRAFTYDPMNRLLTEDDAEQSCGGGAGEDIQYTYDALPYGVSCPGGSTCSLLAGRLAHVKTRITCDSGEDDDTLDQETFNSYDNPGRIVQHTVKDDSGRIGKTSYTYDKSGNILYVYHPSGDYARYEYASSLYYHSDADRTHYLWRNSTMLMNHAYYMPWGPLYSQQLLMAFEHASTMYQIGFAKYRDLALRPTLRQVQSTYSTPDNVFKIEYGQDDRGRITKRDFTYGSGGQVDQFFLYDKLSRVTCRSRSEQEDCPDNNDSELMEKVTYNASGERDTIRVKNAALSEQTHTYVYGDPKAEQLQSITLASGSISFAYDDRGNRISDDDSNYSGGGDDKREYTYDARNNLITVSGQYLVGTNDLNTYVVTNAYDERNRRIFKSFKDTVTNDEAQWFFYYDQWDLLIEAVHVPDVTDPDDYSIYDWYYVEGEPTAYYQLDFADASNTATTARFLFGDDQGRPHTAWSFPPSGSSSRVWEIEAGTWGHDVVTVGSAVHQPLRFPGQYVDLETTVTTSGGALLRPAIADNRFRVYDSATGAFLRPDPNVSMTRETYTYASSNPVGLTDQIGLWSIGALDRFSSCWSLPMIFNPDPKTGGEMAVKFQECFGSGDKSGDYYDDEIIDPTRPPGGGLGGGGGPGGGAWGGGENCWTTDQFNSELGDKHCYNLPDAMLCQTCVQSVMNSCANDPNNRGDCRYRCNRGQVNDSGIIDPAKATLLCETILPWPVQTCPSGRGCNAR